MTHHEHHQFAILSTQALDVPVNPPHPWSLILSLSLRSRANGVWPQSIKSTHFPIGASQSHRAEALFHNSASLATDIVVTADLTTMQNSKNHRNGQAEPNRRGRLTKKSSSFHSHSSVAATTSGASIRRPMTLPDLLLDRNRVAAAAVEVVPRQPPKLLLKVTIMGSLGPVQVVMTPESAVGDLVAAAVSQYVKEGRRPILPSSDPSHFDLHYSQFTLESLDREQKLRNIGSRNFFLCPRKFGDGREGEGGSTTPFASCSREADKTTKGGAFGWLRFMDFSL
ncbi:unnamed protein product [Sphenostylis stenocarpa]|uniref:DUF7054 domain-containing protein n=1 Tax=Sphenostylis stenocarpa TaxID=92480 RepID=A0AA87B9T7_9FABA|nr:unnamed protein product [Sphenostylis stenocarpa]